MIRLACVDAPEKDQPFGPAATEAACRLAGGAVVTVRPIARGYYGRLIAEVELPGGRSLAAELVRLGLAWACKRLRPLQDAARAAGRGLWAGKDPVKPRTWRQKR